MRVTKEMIGKRLGIIQRMYEENNIKACILIQYKPCNIVIAREGVDKPVQPIKFKTFKECYGWLWGYILYFKEWNKELLHK